MSCFDTLSSRVGGGSSLLLCYLLTFYLLARQAVFSLKLVAAAAAGVTLAFGVYTLIRDCDRQTGN